MKLFARIVNIWELLTTSAQGSNLDVWQGSEYNSALPEFVETKQPISQLISQMLLDAVNKTDWRSC